MATDVNLVEILQARIPLTTLLNLAQGGVEIIVMVESVNGQQGNVIIKINGVALGPNTTLADLGIEIPTLVSQLINDAGYITLADVPPAPVISVNGSTGSVILDASSVGAAPLIADVEISSIPANGRIVVGNRTFVHIMEGLGLTRNCNIYFPDPAIEYYPYSHVSIDTGGAALPTLMGVTLPDDFVDFEPDTHYDIQVFGNYAIINSWPLA